MFTKVDITIPHPWFAWYPVIVEVPTNNGIDYYRAWLTTVSRQYIRVAGVNVWKYQKM